MPSLKDDNLNNRLSEARRAMAKDIVEKTKNTKDYSLDDSEKLPLLETVNLEAKRQEAKKAMEGYERQQKRADREAKLQAEKDRLDQIAKIKKQRIFLNSQKKEQLKNQTIIKDNLEKKAKEDYLEKITESENKIKDITSDPTPLSPFRTFVNDTGPQVKRFTNRVINLNNETTEVKSKSFPWVKFFAFLFILVLLVSSLLLLYLVQKQIFNQEKILTPNNIFSLVPVNHHEEIKTLNKVPELIKTEIRNVIRPQLNNQTLIQIYFTLTDPETNTSQRLNTLKFLSILNFDLPTDFIHFLNPEFLVAGFADPTSKDNGLIYIFTTRSFEHTYDQLLRNDTKIISSLFEDLLPLNQVTKIKQSTFSDLLINNQDARVVYDENNQIIASYIFLNPNWLLITSNEASLKAAISAYQKR